MLSCEPVSCAVQIAVFAVGYVLDLVSVEFLVLQSTSVRCGCACLGLSCFSSSCLCVA